MKHFQTLALGGTFDRLHAGHEAFFAYALSHGEHLIIGLTTDEYVKKYKPDSNILSFGERKKELVEFFTSRGKLSQITIFPIEENEVPPEVATKVDALLVTSDTLAGAIELNNLRVELGLSPLSVLTCPLVLSKDHKKLSSSRVRKGEIDRYGEPYVSKDMMLYTYSLPAHLREKFHQPIGEILKTSDLKSIDTQSSIVSVGDVTTIELMKRGITPQISVIDFVVEREKKYSDVKDLGFKGDEYIYYVENKQSTISSGILTVLAHLFYSNKKSNRRSVIVVSGEEDLVVLPAILLAPLGTVVFYGQPKKGLVKVVVNESIKKEMRMLLSKFETIVSSNQPRSEYLLTNEF